MVVVGRVAGRRGGEEKERGRSGLCGHGWCVEEVGRGRREEGEGDGGGGEEERVTDSTEPQNSHLQSLPLAWFVTFTELEQVLKCCLSYRHRINFEVCDFPCEGECHFGTYHREAWLVIFDC